MPSASRDKPFDMPFGARLSPGGGTFFRLWAPDAGSVELCLSSTTSPQQLFEMQPRLDGWFELQQPDAAAGDPYQFRIDRNLLVPDPASRFQAADIHGPSVICDPAAFAWQDRNWQGLPWEQAVIYELHVGTFSPQGTFAGVTERLDYLAELGVSAIELMPVAHFPGACNWGYDGTLHFAPCNRYGSPEDLKRLVEQAHQRGLMVFMDVVYNHFGPEGNYLHTYARQSFFTERFHTPWGAAINFSEAGSAMVREFFICNALYWLHEFHLDGLRFDAVHAIYDTSQPDILEEIAQRVKRDFAGQRQVHLVLENDDNKAHYLVRGADGLPRWYTAQWNDDFHHACHTLITGEKDGYYIDYADDSARHLARCLTEGFAYQGEPSPYREAKQRGEPSTELPLLAFVSFLQNHDQIGNRALGERLVSLCDPVDLKLVIALFLLAPSPPLLFMGEEFGARTPFYFFADFGGELAASVTEGRRKEFAGFGQFDSEEKREQIPDPNDKATFLNSKLDWADLGKSEHRDYLERYKTLLALRRGRIAPLLPQLARGRTGYDILAAQALNAWWRLQDGSRLVACLNLHDEAVELAEALPEEMLYAETAGGTPGSSGRQLPPKSVFWYLDSRRSHG